jgi:hypothetical protein
VNNRAKLSNKKVNSTMSKDKSNGNYRYKIIQPFLSLLTKYFNSRTLVLFNEGLHHHNPETFHQSLQFPLTIFQSLSQGRSSNNDNNNYNGPFFLIRESNSVHFQELLNNNGNITYKSANSTVKHCIQSMINTKKWRNEIIQKNLKRKASSALLFIPFYASTTIWEYDLHFFPDCLHPGCYTPFYWLSLFNTIFEVLSGVKKENRWY